MLFILLVDIMVRFASRMFTGLEATGFVLVTLELLEGISAKPFTVTVNLSEKSPISAEGRYITL